MRLEPPKSPGGGWGDKCCLPLPIPARIYEQYEKRKERKKNEKKDNS